MSEMSQRLHDIRHSAAHLCAQAVQHLFPGTKLTIGPVTETGFFYDFLPLTNFKEEDLARIEKTMHHFARQNLKIIGGQVPKDDARELFKDNQFKLELIDGIEGDTVGVYHQGDFYDLCKGGHTASTGDVKFFKLTDISGSYWRADRDGIALQRIRGIAFETKEELDAYLQRLEDAKMYDHRKLGKELDLFSFHDEAAGMPFFHNNGLIIYNKLIEYMRKLHGDEFQEIRTPIMMSEQLWKTSGHYEFYKNNMYFTQIDENPMAIRPMNCPGSVLVFNERPRSYRELPLRLAEFGHVHRYELSGVLHGLFRVRAFSQDDHHVYCTIDQVEQEVARLLTLADTVYKTFGFAQIIMNLSTRPEKSMGSDEYWDKATQALINAFQVSGIEYRVQEGDGAFYGPKIDMQIEDTMGRLWQCGTIQVDPNIAQNFDVTYVSADQSRQRPVVVHSAIYGSLERFMGIILEHFKGKLPFWISPIQARILMITDQQNEYAASLSEYLKALGIRVECDKHGDKLSAQVRRAQLDKIPWMLVVGQKEAEGNVVTLRTLDGKQEFGLTWDDLAQKAAAENLVIKG